MSFWLKKIANTALKILINEGIKNITQKNKKNFEEKSQNKRVGKTEVSNQTIEKNHPWRLCPIGEHWVKPHSKRLVTGTITSHDGHCRKNTKVTSELYTADELVEIAKNHFHSIIEDPNIMPTPDNLNFPNGNQYDKEIGGWTKFWNDILKPEVPLDQNLVKALIATESSFELPKDQKSKDGAARGLIQITDNTRKILQDTKGELRNHHIKLSVEESRAATTNIAAGIRWLHHKKFLAEHRLKRKISWKEATAEYKGILKDIGNDVKTDQIMANIEKYYQRLENKKKL